MASRFLPFALKYPATGLDNGWKYAVSLAAAQHRMFGTDIVFPYGPFGAVATGEYVPDILAPTILAALLLGAAFFAGVCCITPRSRRLAIWLTPCVLALIPVYDALMFAVPVLAVWVAWSGGAGSLVSMLLLLAALALLPLIKGSLLAASLVAAGLVATLMVARGHWRWAALGAAWLVISFCALWWFAGGSLSALPAYLRGQVELQAGFSEAMQTTGPTWQILQYLAGAGVALALLTDGARRLGRGESWAVPLAGLACLFLAFKAGFVRDDFFHVPNAYFTLVLVCWLAVLLLPPAHAALAAVCGAVMLMSATHGVSASAAGQLIGDAADRLSAQVAGSARLFFDAPDFRRRYDAALHTVRAAMKLPAVSGTADIYSWGQTALLASGAAWRPRPVLQSFTAYTPALAALNLQHLRGAGAPDNVFFRVEPIDGRLPSLEDGPSWDALLRLYRPVAYLRGADSADDVALLRRLAAAEPPPPAAFVPISDTRVRLGEEVRLPPGQQPIWAEFDIGPTLAGQLVGAVFKPPSLRIVLRDEAGETRDFRLVSGMARAGFLLSPLATTTRDFLELAAPGRGPYFAGRRPVSFHVDGASGTGLLWRNRYGVRLSAVGWPAGTENPALDNVGRAAAAAAAAAARVSDDCYLDYANGMAAGRRQIVAAGALHLEGWAAADARHGVTFEQVGIVMTRDADNSTYALTAHRMARPDLPVAFGPARDADAGFFSDSDMSRLAPGRYRLRAVLRLGGTIWSCELPSTVIIPVEGQ